MLKKLSRSILSSGAKEYLRRHAPSFFHEQRSFSQQGEDIISSFCLRQLIGTRAISYLDIGANHPYYLSNTALFYRHGGCGTLVEPDPQYANLLKRKRPRDKVLQCGISTSGTKTGQLFIFNPPTLNTFSPEEAMRYQAMGHLLLTTKHVPLMTPNELLQTVPPLDFLSIDVEGLDFDIVTAIDWKRFRPTVVCAESIIYEKVESRTPKTDTRLIDHMRANGFSIYAQTRINTIFLDDSNQFRLV